MKLNDPAQSRTLAPPEESVLAVRPGRLPARSTRVSRDATSSSWSPCAFVCTAAAMVISRLSVLVSGVVSVSSIQR